MFAFSPFLFVQVHASRCHKVAEIRCRHLRAQEEIGLVTSEMLSVLRTLGMHHAQILKITQQHDIAVGIKMALMHQLEKVHFHYLRAREVFSEWLVDLPDIPESFFQVHHQDAIDPDIIKESIASVTSDSECSSDDGEDDDEDGDDHVYM